MVFSFEIFFTMNYFLATNEEDMPKYQAICEKLGDLAVNQGAYAGAAKKYLDAGNKIKVYCCFRKSNVDNLLFLGNSCIDKVR